MAIAYNSGTYAANTSGTSLTFAFNNAAGDYIAVAGYNRSGTTSVTGITYNAQALTRITFKNGAAGTNDRAVDAWSRVSPATGSNNVVVTSSPSSVLRYSAMSYSGVDQTTPENGTNTGTAGSGSTSYSIAITTTVEDCWMISMSKDRDGLRTYTSTTSDTIRLNNDEGGSLIVDTGSSFAAGANTMTVTMSSVTGIGGIAWAIRPAAGDAVNTTNFFQMM